MAGKSPHPDPVARAEHMTRRHIQGQTVRRVAKEFGVSKSTAHRYIAANHKKAKEILDRGYSG